MAKLSLNELIARRDAALSNARLHIAVAAQYFADMAECQRYQQEITRRMG